MEIKNSTVFAYLGVLNLIYLFIGLSNSSLQSMVFFYLLMLNGGVISAYMIYKGNMPEKMHLDKISIISLFIGLVVAEILVLIELGFYGALSYVIPYKYEEALKGYLYMIAVAFVVGNTEELFFRGFLNSLAETYSASFVDMKLSKYLIIPALFGISHYFAWSNSAYSSVFVSLYMFMYHFVFGVAMQYLEDYTGSLYPSITAHTIYDATKMLMGGL